MSVAATLSNIAGVYNSQGKYKEALENMEKVLEIQQKSLGLEHVSVQKRSTDTRQITKRRYFTTTWRFPFISQHLERLM